MKAKVEELTRIKIEYERDIAILKSSMEEMERVRKEKELMERGVLNSLEDEKKVLKERLSKYIERVPSMIKKLKELRETVKENATPNNNKNKVNELKKALKEAEEKIEKVTLEKVRVEAESKMTARMNTNLEAMLAMYQGGGARAAVSPVSPGLVPAPSPGLGQHKDRDVARKYYKFEKGQCNMANCNFLHPDSLISMAVLIGNFSVQGPRPMLGGSRCCQARPKLKTLDTTR